MNPNKALWEKGDFTRIAESMRQSGEALVQGIGITKGLSVLDLGCGDGTTALKLNQPSFMSIYEAFCVSSAADLRLGQVV